MEANPRCNLLTSSGKPSQRSGRCYSSKGGDQLHSNAHDFGMRYWTNRCPHTFGHIVYLRRYWNCCITVIFYYHSCYYASSYYCNILILLGLMTHPVECPKVPLNFYGAFFAQRGRSIYFTAALAMFILLFICM